MAYRQALCTPGRALLTWGILFMAVATSVATAMILTDVLHDLHSADLHTDRADFVVRVAKPNLTTGAAAKLPEGLAAQVRGMDGVQSVEITDLIGMERPEIGRIVAVVREFSMHEQPPLVLGDVDLPDVRRQILQGGVVLSDILAYRLQRKVGDKVTLEYEGKQYDFHVAGTTPLFLAGGMAFFMDRQVAEQRFGPLGGDALLVNGTAAQRASLGERLRALSLARGLLFQTYSEVQQRLQNIVDTVAASLWVLLTLGFLIAVFGVTNTLMMSILEQTREIGLTRSSRHAATPGPPHGPGPVRLRWPAGDPPRFGCRCVPGLCHPWLLPRHAGRSAALRPTPPVAHSLCRRPAGPGADLWLAAGGPSSATQHPGLYSDGMNQGLG